MRKIIYLLFILTISIYAQDTTRSRSQAFKDNRPPKLPRITNKYPSYSLLAGYLLVTEANKGDVFAQHELGIRYLIGSGFQADTVKAIYWIRKAVDQNLAPAKFNYGILLYNGIGVPWNPFEAHQNFKGAADAGLPEAQFAVAISYMDNLTLNRDLNKAYQYCKLAAETGYKPAVEALKDIMKNGFVPPTDSLTKNEKDNLPKRVEDASPIIDQKWDVDFYDFESKDNTNKNANQITELLNKKPQELKRYLGLDEISKEQMPEDTSGISLLKFAAQSGSPEALLILARSYEDGVLSEKNPIVAAVNYLQAYRLGSYKAVQYLLSLLQYKDFETNLKQKVTEGNPDALYTWAAVSALGFSSQITDQQALDFLKKAVDKKHVSSMLEMGLLYSSGKLVKKDPAKAIEYWNMAKKYGSKEAEVRIALSHIVDSTATNIADDVRTITQIANEGSVFAETALGYCFEKGMGVKENKATAVKYYRRAAQRGNETAYNSLKRLYDDIRPYDEEFNIYEVKY